MSDQHSTHTEHPTGPIKTPKQLIVAVLLSFLVPILVIILLVSYVSSERKTGAGSDAMSAEAIARRIQPVGTVAIRDASNLAALKSGEDVFKAQCSACHSAGVAGAPKFGDAGAWGARIKKGYEALLTSALKGKGAMAPQGGGDFSDAEIGRAVVYLANAGGAKFAEPRGTAPQAAAAADAKVTAAMPVAAPAVAQVKTEPAKAGSGAKAGQALYNQACVACHATGVAGAPKFGDKAAWAPRIKTGVDALVASVIKGKGAMPPKGGAATASEADIKAAVTYMVSAAK